jgi:multidrug efflux pump subunit AcrA (membrane-fusion protein)
MKKLFMSRSFHVLLAVAMIGFIIFMVVAVRSNNEIEYITTVVEQGVVERLVSVSGVIEAEQSADLAFPTTGIVSVVNIKKGDVVQAGDVLVTLEARALAADRQDAVAALTRAIATRDELLAGPQIESREATAETVAFKATSLETIKATQADLVANAYRTLLSSGLTAISLDGEDDAVAPTISGTYTCNDEGVYNIELYSSSANSGYSFRLSGLESGTYTASTDQATSFGDCGLRIIFDSASEYRNSVWTVTIPNRESSLYIINRNNYTLAQTQSGSAITLAEQDLSLAEANALSTNAPARSESTARANADIASANARIARIDAQIADRTIRAPFSGTVVEIDVLPGETVTTVPVVTILASADFELTARIPEIDVGKLEIGQVARAIFDAKMEETLTGVIDFISPQATLVDGVAYYEVIVSLDETPSWIRSGLNADIDIVTVATTDNLRVPQRFLTQTDGEYFVTLKNGELISTTSVTVILEGNDGFAAITGLNVNDIIVAP